MLKVKTIMKESRKIKCTSCGRPGVTIKDARLGWIFEEPGWALVNYSNVCPSCNAKMVENNRIVNEKNRQKFMEG